jgi:DNA primase
MKTDADFAQFMKVVALDLLGEPTSKRGNEWRWGTNGSLSIDIKSGIWFDHETKTGGGVLDFIKQKKGIEGAEALEYLRGLGCDIDEPKPKGKRERQEAYDYRDEYGNVVYQVERWLYRLPDGSLELTKKGKIRKTFTQRRADGQGSWTEGKGCMQGVRWLPYRLQELIEALSHERTVFVPEGERKVDLLLSLGVPATCNPMGANKWPPGFADFFNADDDLLLLPDNDQEGRKHVLDIGAKLLNKLKVNIRVLELPGLPPGGDVKDWFEAGGTREELYRLVETQAVPFAEYKPPSPELDKEKWPDIIPLPPQLMPVARFDLAFLPEAIAPWVADIAERMQCPLDLVGVPAMAALGAVLGTKIGVHPKQYDDWREVPNFWCCIIGRPGTLKSPALHEVLKPVRELDARAKQRFEETLKLHKGDLEAFKMRKDAAMSELKSRFKKSLSSKVVDLQDVKNIKAAEQAEAEKAKLEELIRELPPNDPKEHRYIVNDSTYEALGAILAVNPQGVLVERDELVSLLVNLDREELATSRGFYLQGWNGTGTYNFDRITRGHTKVSKLCLSLVGCATPGGIGSYIRNAMSGGKGDDGLLQRFSLAVWPDQCDWKLIDRLPDIGARNAARDAFQRLDDYQAPPTAETDPNNLTIRSLRFCLEAQPRFVAWYRALEIELRNLNIHPALLSHFGKYRKLIPTLALVNHIADNGTGSISLDALERAIAFGAYLKTHALRLYGAETRADIEAAHAILDKIKARALSDEFSARDIYRAQWAGLKNPGTVAEALGLLQQHNIIAARTMQAGKRTWTAFAVHPKLQE